jgi:hypothetical protein
MGCYDLYCDVCGASFTSYNPKYYPDMTGIDTKWLDDAVLEYNNNSNCSGYVEVSNYDSYGRFEDKNGVEHDIVEKHYNKEVKIYHSLCKGKQPNKQFSRYQQQHFNIDQLVKDGKKHMLDKAYIMKH